MIFPFAHNPEAAPAQPDSSFGAIRAIFPAPAAAPPRRGKRNRCARRPFTFIEILIAAAILAVSMGLAFQIIGNARARLLRAERRWARQHNLDQATEFFLLAGPKAAPPPGLLPEGFSATCQVDTVPAEDLPEYAGDEYRGWVLARMTVTVHWRGGGAAGSQTIEKIIRADALQ